MTKMITEAIAFIDNAVVVKEMLYPEFEAILDNVVAINEYKDKDATAVYLRIDQHLKIRAAVFFYLGFDQRGYVDKNWNIPLRHLADTGGVGPDLGAGPIKLSCRSQCSVSWHQRGLWDPELDGVNNSFTHLARAVKNNRLGLAVTEPESQVFSGEKNKTPGSVQIPTTKDAEQALKHEFKQRMESLAQDHKLRLETMKSETKSHLEKVQKSFRQQINQLNETLQATKQLFLEEKHKNLELRRAQEKHVETISRARKAFQVQTANSDKVAHQQLLELEQKFELEMEAKLDATRSELKEMLEMKEVEVFYRDEQIKRLKKELSGLRQQKDELLAEKNILQLMSQAGISFIDYQQGLEHLTVPLNELEDYLLSPLNYRASKTGLDVTQYKKWLDHYKKPVCGHVQEDGSLCARVIQQLEKPRLFIEGESDRCSAHIEYARYSDDMGLVNESE